MHCAYDDIRERIREEPKWWDERMVPRYCDFSPEHLANIYADEAALALVACQRCGYRFKVASSSSLAERILLKARLAESKFHSDHFAKVSDYPIADLIRGNALHFGDPPNIGCCDAGPTMTSDTIGVLEYWRRWRKTGEWVRDKSLETISDK